MLSAALSAVVAATAVHFVVSPIPEVSTEAYAALYVVPNLFMCLYNPFQSSTLTTLCVVNFIFLLTSTVLTVVRRLYFSPLSKFPGPRLAAVSGLWNANEARHGRAHKTQKALHEKFDSDVIRIGPNELSINNVDALGKIYDGKYLRGTFNTVFNLPGGENVNSLRDNKLHSAWRRILAKSFTKSEMPRIIERLRKHIDRTIQILHDKAGSPVEAGQLLGFLAYDAIDDIAFSYDSGLQDGRGDGSILDLMDGALGVFKVAGHLPHLQQIMRYLPPNADGKRYGSLADQIYDAHKDLKAPTNDVLSHLKLADDQTGIVISELDIKEHILLILTVGAHSVSTTLKCTFAALASRPDIQEKLSLELRAAFGGDRLPAESLGRLKLLDAVVREGLRMFPPLLGGTPAVIPKGGVMLESGHFLPQHTQVYVSQYGLGWQERYFPRAKEFLPERWLQQNGEERDGPLINDRRAWIPFGYGTHSCGGRALALEELKLVLASVVRDFDVRFREDQGQKFDYDHWVDGIKDHFLTIAGKIDLVFERRTKA